MKYYEQCYKIIPSDQGHLFFIVIAYLSPIIYLSARAEMSSNMRRDAIEKDRAATFAKDIVTKNPIFTVD